MEEQRHGLGTVVVDRQNLKRVVEENRNTHRAGFEEAMAGYKAKAIELLEEHIERIKDNAPEKVVVTLPMPEDHSAEYDLVLSMLKWELNAELELTSYEFAQYVQDEWGWKQEWTASNALYTGSG